VQIWTDAGLAGEGQTSFFVSPPVDTWKGPVDVLDPANRFQERFRAFTPNIEPNANVILVVPPANTVRAFPDGAFGQILGRVREGCVAIVFGPPADWNDLAPVLSSPLDAAAASLLRDGKAGVLGRLHPVFEGLPTGGLLGRPYRGLLTHRYFPGDSEDDIAPVAARTDSPPGACIAVRRFGNGRIVFVSLRILERLGVDPVATRMFVNLLKYCERRALPVHGITRGEMRAVEWLRQEKAKLRVWRLIGPFPNCDGSGHRSAYPPEVGFDPLAAYVGEFRALTWMTFFTGPRHIEEVDLTAALAPESFVAEPIAGTCYAYSELIGESRAEILLAFKHAGAAKVWLNGRLVYSSPESAPEDNRAGHAETVALKQGRNSLLVKVSTVKTPAWFSLDVRGDSVPQWR
jgi:hypothetical protein